jgi:hypothetical protein
MTSLLNWTPAIDLDEGFGRVLRAAERRMRQQQEATAFQT